MIQKVFLSTALLCLYTLAASAEPLDDKAFQKLMKEVGSTTKRFKTGIDNQDAAQVGKDAARVAALYQQMTPFWKQRKADKAVQWSETSAASAAAAATAAKNGDWAGVKQHVQGVMKHCKSCHDTHREKLEDGSYRIK